MTYGDDASQRMDHELLSGLYFLTVCRPSPDDDEEVGSRGKILALVSEGYYLIELYNGVTGKVLEMQVIPVTQIAREQWRLFATWTAMAEYD